MKHAKIEAENAAPIANEKDTNSVSLSERADWFCEFFGANRPQIVFDPDEPQHVLMTDALITWADHEGVSLDWLVGGDATGALAVYREKYRTKATEESSQQAAKASFSREAYSMYGGERRDYISLLYDILNLTIVGAASAENENGVPHLDVAQRTLFETIHRMASEAIDCAETDERTKAA